LAGAEEGAVGALSTLTGVTFVLPGDFCRKGVAAKDGCCVVFISCAAKLEAGVFPPEPVKPFESLIVSFKTGSVKRGGLESTDNGLFSVNSPENSIADCLSEDPPRRSGDDDT
jgi:hypothetical protein